MKIVYAKYGRCPQENLDDVGSLAFEPGEKGLPWLKGESMLYLGEIENMPGHGTYARKTGEIFYGYHTDSFVDSDMDGHLYLDDFLELKTDLQNKKKYFCLNFDKLEQLMDVCFINRDLLKTFNDYSEDEEHIE